MSELLKEYETLLIGRWLTDLANTSAFLFQEVPDLNWVGFYLLSSKNVLELGPFQGRVACTDIEFGRGVCGTSASERKTLVVPDVESFPGHIACDPRSRSELVVPLIMNGKVLGVLDVDSHLLNRFTVADQAFFEGVAQRLIDRQHWVP